MPSVPDRVSVVIIDITKVQDRQPTHFSIRMRSRWATPFQTSPRADSPPRKAAPESNPRQPGVPICSPLLLVLCTAPPRRSKQAECRCVPSAALCAISLYGGRPIRTERGGLLSSTLSCSVSSPLQLGLALPFPALPSPKLLTTTRGEIGKMSCFSGLSCTGHLGCIARSFLSGLPAARLHSRHGHAVSGNQQHQNPCCPYLCFAIPL